jgi:hypothetical protein
MLVRVCIIATLITASSGIPAFGTTFTVKPDGTGDFETIQAAVDGCEDGDTIELTDGVFEGAGNRDVDFKNKPITIRSQSGDPTTCIIDCGGTPEEFHRGFIIHRGEGPDSKLEGVTIRNGVTGGG